MQALTEGFWLFVVLRIGGIPVIATLGMQSSQ
jgi:hypothetical protein